MQMSQGGIDNILKNFEGCKLTAYKCPAGIWTIGYGHTSAAGAPEVTESMVITQEQAGSILKADLAKYEIQVAELVKVPLSQNQFDVLVDFAYNAGVGNLKSSTLLKKVNAGEFDAVPDELMRWTKGGGKILPGLVRRRQAEVSWWNAGTQEVSEQESRIEPDAVPAKTMVQSKQGNAAIVTSSLGAIGVAKEVATQAQEASDTADQLMKLLHNQNFLIMAVILGLGVAIWWWRKQNMERDGV